jgi:hypothetical protein
VGAEPDWARRTGQGGYVRARSKALLAGGALIVGLVAAAPAPQPGPPKRIDLAKWFVAGKLRAVNRDITKLPDRSDGLHMSERLDPGLVWIEGSDFTEGAIEVDVRGRDQFQRSFVGIAFHGKDDKTYEAVYLRPFNFRAQDPVRHRHALQYMAVPEFDWPRLREQFADEFERPVDASVAPTDWVTLRVVVQERTVQVYVGPDKMPALAARKLGSLNRGIIGLWTGNGSDGDFANLRITPTR